jgi:hypothetical protein
LVFDLQKADTPDDLDVLRLFYKSLYDEEEKARTEKVKKTTPLTMAEKWCMERGIFSDTLQESLFERLQNEKASKK